MLAYVVTIGIDWMYECRMLSVLHCENIIGKNSKHCSKLLKIISKIIIKCIFNIIAVLQIEKNIDRNIKKRYVFNSISKVTKLQWKNKKEKKLFENLLAKKWHVLQYLQAINVETLYVDIQIWRHFVDSCYVLQFLKWSKKEQFVSSNGWIFKMSL
jgi:hypothetical protein